MDVPAILTKIVARSALYRKKIAFLRQAKMEEIKNFWHIKRADDVADLIGKRRGVAMKLGRLLIFTELSFSEVVTQRFKLLQKTEVPYVRICLLPTNLDHKYPRWCDA